ncbi:unnamed protein product [Brachionus calyciflorus]|uniref:Large ribosomal subunit protein uL18m n=1 Tax=Brachionus calyciflorus TaxID=104777 RepID=A0A814HSK5_9BILA|nr:unnamed protein product [Brachionus calyciflorus]
MNGLKNLTKIRNQIKIPFSVLSQVRGNSTESEKVLFSPNYENRNPRNLEWSGHQYKRFGWNLQYPPKDFYHQCVFKSSKNYLEAYVEHHSGKKIIHLSTDDPALRQYLYSAKDLSATKNLARVFADRCHQFGINQMHYFKGTNFETSSKEQLFYKVLEESGIKLEEPEFIERFDQTPGLDNEDKNFHHDRQNKPFPPDLNQLKKA